MRQIADFISVLACALFTGASIYVNLVEHPARMQCGVEIAATVFPPSYRRGTIMQATLALLGLVASLAAWLAGETLWWLVAGVLLGAVIPFTLIVILPTNKRLLSPELDRHSIEVERLLARWNALHAVRSVLSGLALLSFLFLLIFKQPLILVRATFSASAQQPTCALTASNAEQEVLRLEQHWLEVEDNPDALEPILAEDFVHVVPQGIITKSEQLDYMRKHPRHAPRGRHFQELRVRTFGITAIGTGIVVSTHEGEPQRSLFTDVFAYRDGKWQAVSGQELIEKAVAPP